MLPEQSGIILEIHQNVSKYFVLENHYDNPEGLDFEDNSGFRLFFNDKVRENDLGILTVGNQISPLHFIPPETPQFTTMGYCTSECTLKSFPSEGIKITHVMSHANAAATKIRVRHLRNRIELPFIVQDSNYYYTHQPLRQIKPERKVLPGDILLVECEYDTTWKNYLTFGGLTSRDETCLVFLYYYPKGNLTECGVQLERSSFLNAAGIQEIEGETKELILQKSSDNYSRETTNPNSNSDYNSMKILRPVTENRKTVGEYLRNINWEAKNDERVKNVANGWLKGKHNAYCIREGRKHIALKDNVVSYPKYLKYRPKPDRQCHKNSTVENGKSGRYPRVKTYGYDINAIL